MFKNFLAVVAGVLTAMVLIGFFEWLDWYFYPMPPGTDIKNPDVVNQLISQMPIGAFLWLLVGYAVASFGGGFVATLISGKERSMPALITGSVVTLGGIMNLCMIHHPWWFVILNVAEYLPFAWLGYWTVGKLSPGFTIGSRS
jgi:hypothetical protein